MIIYYKMKVSGVSAFILSMFQHIGSESRKLSFKLYWFDLILNCILGSVESYLKHEDRLIKKYIDMQFVTGKAIYWRIYIFGMLKRFSLHRQSPFAEEMIIFNITINVAIFLRTFHALLEFLLILLVRFLLKTM